MEREKPWWVPYSSGRIKDGDQDGLDVADIFANAWMSFPTKISSDYL